MPEPGAIAVLAEKPSVARDIARILGATTKGDGYLHGNGYIVTWAIGHLVALPQPHEIKPEWRRWGRDLLPMLPTEWPLVVYEKTKDQFETVRKILDSPRVARLVCATDAGREGELIFRYIYEAAHCTKPVSRLWISSLTPDAIRQGFASLKPSADYDPLADAARGRSRADWLVGMNLSRAYSIAYNEELSVGRVQTPTLAILVDRELAIRNFVPEDYFEVQATFHPVDAPKDTTYEGTWFRDQPEGPRITRLPVDTDEAQLIADRARTGKAAIESIDSETQRMPPPPLYDLTELQRHANRAFGFSAQKTLDLAQALYERHKLISYPRTDSRHLSRDVAATLPGIVKVIAGPYRELLAPGTGERPLGRRFVDDAKVTDHHAIIPTTTPLDKVTPTPDERKIYDLICRRLLAAWHDDHITSVTTVITAIANPAIIDRYHTSGTVIQQVGWKVLELADRRRNADAPPALPSILAKDQPQDVVDVETRRKTTRPPKRLTEATLLTAMETAGKTLDEKELADAMKDNGLGTPATRAAIIEVLLKRAYVIRNGKSLEATDKGIHLIEIVHPEVKSPAMTGQWEAHLQRIHRGKEKLAPFLQGIEEYVTRVVGQAIVFQSPVNPATAGRYTAPGASRTLSRPAPSTAPGTTGFSLSPVASRAVNHPTQPAKPSTAPGTTDFRLSPSASRPVNHPTQPAKPSTAPGTTDFSLSPSASRPVNHPTQPAKPSTAPGTTDFSPSPGASRAVNRSPQPPAPSTAPGTTDFILSPSASRPLKQPSQPPAPSTAPGTRDSSPSGASRVGNQPSQPSSPSTAPGTTDFSLSPVGTNQSLTALLHQTFGFPSFRPNQEAVCQAAVEGNDVLLVMPTGSGKSLCYQLPGVARGGTTLVISPLIALMEDQVAALKSRGLAVERIHSGRDRAASRQACIDYLNGNLQFLFIAPERLRVAGFPEMLAKRKPSLIAIDEAHCISQWGHDFRPDYRMFGHYLPSLRPAPVIALTATATPIVQDDISSQLGLTQAARFIHGFRRDNIAIEVVEIAPSQRSDMVREMLLDPARRPAIVYTPTRKQADALSKQLHADFPSDAYHAGLDAAHRKRVQEEFLLGKLDVMVATIAFGMGIDKPNVRTVIHTALPGSIEAYYQEIGRAGRDGQPSRAVLMHSYADRHTHDFFFERDYPDVKILDALYARLRAEPQPKEALQRQMRIDPDIFDKALEKLWIHRGALLDFAENATLGQPDWRDSYIAHGERKREQIEQVIRYASGNQCRMSALVRHFGDFAAAREACNICDFCAPTECVAQQFRAATPAEREAIERIAAALRGSDAKTTGKLHAEVFPKGEMTRDDFEEVLGAMARAGLARLTDAVFEKEGKTIPYRKVTLTRADVDLDAVMLRSEMAFRPSKGRKAKRRGTTDFSLSGGRKAKRAKRIKTPAVPPTVPPPARVATNVERNAKLEEALKTWRLTEARRAGVPAFRILTDRALRAIATTRPVTAAELLAVPGIGIATVEKYGHHLYRILNNNP